jgi:fructose-1,6-bisphosphatase/inositol monophosphatase family enzyme
VAAGYLILKEAGGIVTKLSGEEFSIYGKEILAVNNKEIQKAMIEIINGN